MGTLILVRHGENEWTRKGKLAGKIPGVHLNEAGHQQAQAAAKRLAALPIKAVYSSPLTRCAETAAYIADTHRLTTLFVDDLGEVEYGEWEGKKIEKLARKPLWRAVQFFPSRMRFPRGEALREVQFRAVQALEEIAARHEKEVVVVVSHADIIRLLLAYYLGVHIDLFQRLVISPASASVLHLSPDGMSRVLRFNDDGPLHSPSQPEGWKKDKKAGKKRKETSRETESPDKQDSKAGSQAASGVSANGNKPNRALHPTSSAALDEEE